MCVPAQIPRHHLAMTHSCLVCRWAAKQRQGQALAPLVCAMTVCCKVSDFLPCWKTSPGPGPGEALAWDEAPGGFPPPGMVGMGIVLMRPRG